MLKKLFTFVFFIGFLLLTSNFFLLSFANAQELLFGQKQYYSVILRGNGEAVVYSKIILSNPSDQELNSISFEIPKADVSELVMYQQVLPQKCAAFERNLPLTCTEYDDPDYTNQYFYDSYTPEKFNGKPKYFKLNEQKTGNLYKADLNLPIKPQKSGSIIIAYVARGYVTKFLGVNNFDFQTLKIPYRTESVKVVVDVDTDLYLKGKQSEVNYSSNIADFSSGSNFGSLQSSNLDLLSSQIGNYGDLIKEAKGLSPNETFKVKGDYSNNWFLLYLKQFAIVALIIISILIFLRMRKPLLHQTNNSPKIAITGLSSPTIGLISAALVFGLTIGLSWISKSGILPFFAIDQFIGIFIFIVVLLLYILVIFTPAIMHGAKQGWKNTVYVVVWELIWLLLFVGLYLILFKGFPQNPGDSGSIRPL